MAFLSLDIDLFDEIDPLPRLLMGPGPVNAHPRVLRAMSAPLLGQFDAQFTLYMQQVQRLYRRVFETRNEATFLVNATARGAIEAVLMSLVEPGERVLVPVFGRFGELQVEIAQRIGADVRTIEAPWGEVFSIDALEAALKLHRPKVVSICHGDTSTTMAQPLDELGALCRRYDALLYVDATATLGGMKLPVDRWQIDAVTAGLQKCLGGPAGSSPITLGPRAVAAVQARRPLQGSMPFAPAAGHNGHAVASNYFDLGMIIEYWGKSRSNHHTEAGSMLYAARECARVLLGEGLDAGIARHARADRAMQAGLSAMGLRFFGDQQHKMRNVTGVVIPAGIDGDRVRARMVEDFSVEIGTSFGALHGAIWRIGTMGYNARKDAVLAALGALESVLAAEGFRMSRGAGVDAALAAFAPAAELEQVYEPAA